MRTQSQQAVTHDAASFVRAPLPLRGSSSCLKVLSNGAQIVAGSIGDHPLVLQFLIQSSQTPRTEDFLSRLDEPTYQPNDRLLLRQRGELAAHIQLCSRVGWFGGEQLPLAVLVDFASLPEYHETEYESALLEIAESTARREGASAGLIRTTRQDWFARRGWSRLRDQGHTRANTRAILAYFDAHQTKSRLSKNSQTKVRSWRHFELDAIRSVYRQTAPNLWGPLRRSEAWWQWLVGRKAQEHVLLAVDATRPPRQLAPRKSAQLDNGRAEELAVRVALQIPERHDQDAVGYAVVRDSNVIEMFTSPGRHAVRSQLLARACRDAIDRGHDCVSLLTPPSDPLHEVMITAGGNWISDDDAADGSWMFKLFAPERWTEKLYPVLRQRSQAAGLSRPLQFTLGADDHNRRFTLTRRSARLELSNQHPSDLPCTWHEFQDLLASNLRQSDAVLRRSGSLQPILETLFAPKLFWQSSYEWLRL